MFHFVPFWIQKKNLDLSEFDNFGRLMNYARLPIFFQLKKVIFRIKNPVSSGIIP